MYNIDDYIYDSDITLLDLLLNNKDSHSLLNNMTGLD